MARDDRVASLREYLDGELTKAAQPSPPKRIGRALEWQELEQATPPERQWLIPFWLPCGNAALLAGKAGSGKTLIAQHLGTALALGADYLEPIATPRKVLMLAGEDDHDELWRRQLEISSFFGATLSALAGKFMLRSCAKEDLTLAAPVFGTLSPTPLMALLREQVQDLKCDCVILDNIARIYGGNENDRHQVTAFVSWVDAACAPAAVLLVGHPAKAAGSEFSGSGAWEAAVRARMYFGTKPPDQDDEGEEESEAESDVRYLARRKANYSALEMRKLRLIGAVLRPIDQPRLNGHTHGDAARDAVRWAVARLAERDLYGTASTASPSFLPKLAKQYGLLRDITERQFASSMREMVMDGELATQQVGRYQNRTPRMGLVVRTNGTHK